MKGVINRFVVGLLFAALIVFSSTGCKSGAPKSDERVWFGTVSSTSEGIQVGTFSRHDLVVAFYRSTVHEQYLKELMERRDKAKAAGDNRRVAELESEGVALQDLAHEQLAGKAPLSNVEATLKDYLPQVADAARVDAIVEEGFPLPGSAREIDVTDLLVKYFKGK